MMKSKHRRSHRRYSGRRRNERNRSKILAILIILFIIAVVVGSVFLGKHLKEKAEISEANRLDSDTAIETDGSADTEEKNILFSARPPERIEAIHVPLGSISELEQDIPFASVIFRDKSGELSYSSAVAQTLGGQSAENPLMSAVDIIAQLDEKCGYISAVFSLSEHSEESGITTDAVHAYEQALIGEIAAAGADEILLCINGELNEERIKMLCSFSETYRTSDVAEVPLGLVLPYSFFTLERANELCRSLADCYEFLAVDYTDASENEEMTASEIIQGRIDSMQMYISRYSLRIILDSEGVDFEEAKNTLAEEAVYSFQTVDRALIYDDIAPNQDAE